MPKATSGGGDLSPIPAGSALAVCYGVIDVGTPPQHGNFPSHRTVVLLFELPMIREDFTVDGVMKNLPRVISSSYTLSISKKANLRKVLIGWRGRDFTPEEEKDFEVGNVCGANALLSIIHKQSKDGTKTYANIATIMKPMAGSAKIVSENKKIIFDIPASGPITIPDELPEWIANRIKASDEYIERSQMSGAKTTPTPDQMANVDYSITDEDVPF